MGKMISNLLRFLFSWIDGIVAKLITIVYRLILNLSDLVLYSDDIVKTIGKRIGLMLGIFMLFKLAISLISYMISPDKLNDGKQGGGRLIVNVLISLGLLISINLIFKEAYKIQGVIVESRIIEKVFFGNNALVMNSNNNNNTSGEVKMDIGYYLYSGFFIPNKDVFGSTCDNIWDVTIDIDALTNEQKEAHEVKTCDDLLYDKIDNEARKSIYNARNSMDMSYVFFFFFLVLATPASKTFAFDCWPIVSTAAGIIVLLVLLSFSMDLATRAVKLLFLQIIAPIPIISNMDMGKGQDIFKKWGKECINTYLTVFIRLITIDFAVFMIVLLRGNYKDLFVNNIWLNIFLIIGCLMFAKQVPKLLEDFFGIKMDGMALNPLKKFQEQALFGKQIGGVVGGVAGGLTAGGLAASAGFLTGQGLHRTAFTTAFKNGVNGEKFGKNFTSSYSAIRARHTQLRDMRLDDVGRTDVAMEKIRDFFGNETRSAQVQRLANQGKNMDAAFERIKGQLIACDKNDGAFSYNFTRLDGSTGTSNRSAKTIAKELEEVKKSTVSRSDYADTAAGEAQYNAAIRAQRERVANMEAELEGRIDAATRASLVADKVILEQADLMIDIKKSSNELGLSLDKNYQTITANDDQIVSMMKQGKNISSQASSGTLQSIADVAKYSGKDKK